MAKKKAASGDEPGPSFEDAMQELEGIVRRLEMGGDPLEKALGDYAQAIGLLKVCHGNLAEAERRVEILSGLDAQGNPVTQPVEESDSSLEEKQQTRSRRRTATDIGKSDENSDTFGLF